jgi:Glycosyltransferase family 87
MVTRNGVIGAMVVAAFWVLVFSSIWRQAWSGDNDFVVFYCGGKLALSAQLYEPEACYAMQRALFSTSVPSLTYIRLPFHALGMALLAWLPYHAAYLLYQTVQLAAVIWAVRALARDKAELIFFACFSPALLLGAANGQDTGFLFALVVAVWMALRREADFTAGLLLSLCAIKPHLFVLVPIVMVVHRRWNVLKGAALGGLALIGISFAANGSDWPGRFLEAISNPIIHPVIGSMTAIYNATQFLFGANPVPELVAAVVAAAGLAWITAKSDDIAIPYALALVLGLLVGHHANMQDTVLALAALGIFLVAKAPAAAIALTAVACTPPSALALLAGRPWSFHYLILLGAILAVLLIDSLQQEQKAAHLAPC